MDITIEKMDKSHISAIAEIERECFSTPWSENALSEELENPNSRFFVAVIGDKVIGYGGMHSVIGENYIDNIAVTSSYRKMGVATEILQQLVKTAENENGDFISLEVRESNEAAISLYEKSGFARVGVRRNFYQKPIENGIIMTKEIKE